MMLKAWEQRLHLTHFLELESSVVMTLHLLICWCDRWVIDHNHGKHSHSCMAALHV